MLIELTNPQKKTTKTLIVAKCLSQFDILFINK